MYPEAFDGLTIGGVYVHEPGALISNIAVAFTGWLIYFNTPGIGTAYARFWRRFVLFIACGATGGSVVHGFPHLLGPDGLYAIWGLKNACVPVANLFAALAVFRLASSVKPSVANLFRLKAVLVIAAMFAFYSFLPVAIDLAITYLVVLGITYGKRRTYPPADPIFRGFLIAFLSGFLYVIRYDVHPLWFTHKDAVHVFVIISLLFIGKGILSANRRVERIAVSG